MDRIHESLIRALQRNRLVFWYDAAGEWLDSFEAFADSTVTRIRVADNEFDTKVRIARDSSLETKYLLYFPAEKPVDAQNWLLDLLYQSHEFRADKASLLIEEVGLPPEYRHLVEEHAAFFKSAKRVDSLREQIGKDDSPADVRLKMISILTGASASVDSLLLHFLDKGSVNLPIDPIEEILGPSKLIDAFWQDAGRLFGYRSANPSLRDFAVSLFRGANPLDNALKLHPHGKVFLRQWQDSARYQESFRSWSRQMQDDLHVGAALEGVDDRFELGDSDAFEIFDKFTIHRLCKRFTTGASPRQLREAMEERRESFWYGDHAHAYAALENAVQLRELLGDQEFRIESIDRGIERYMAEWWRVDGAYRRCVWNMRRYGQVQVMQHVSDWVEKAYVNSFLLPLTDCWSDRVAQLSTWTAADVPLQREFFDTHVQSFRSKNQKVVVVVSDALRYEAAMEFAQRLISANRWSAETTAMLGALPSFTQLGMASLLPGRERRIDAATGAAMVDGLPASGTPARAEILRRTVSAATAIQAEELLAMNQAEGRELTRAHEVVYVYHNKIDKVGDDGRTEAQAFEAVDATLEDLEKIVRKLASMNVSNIILTADHGFLFQQEPVADADMVALPQAEVTYRNRRFILGKNIVAKPGVKSFSAAALGISSDWEAAFPLSLGRFPQPGSGKRFVHGGVSLQEVVVPVVRIRKTRSDDVGHVHVDLMRVPAKITTGLMSIALFQEQPAAEKVLPRILKVGVYAQDGTLISDVRTLTFDSADPEPRRRETAVVLTLSHAADTYNNSDVEIRLEETLTGTSQTVLYKKHTVRLQKPFSSDFDDDL